MFERLKHAFAAETHPEPPTAEQMQLVDRVAKEVVRRRLTVPAMAFLEMSRPLNYLSAQLMHFFSPVLTAILNQRDYENFANFLERRDSIELLSTRIEELFDAESRTAESDSEPSPPANTDV